MSVPLAIADAQSLSDDSLWHACLFSLGIALMAAVFAALFAIPVAYALARKRFWGKSFLEALLTVPLVLPPTVVGYGLIVLMGRRGVVGQFVSRWFGGYTVLFRPEGAVLAAFVVALPLLYLPAKAAFVGVERELEDVAKLLGAGRWRTFWQVSLPLARRQIAAGLLLAFARALGEFGATIMVLGDLAGRRTLPIVIFDATNGQDYQAALPAVAALGAVSLAVVLLYNRLPFSRQE
ncbi:MAG: molybdate ABC transporter permease subunit [Tepidisphaeraceae bacterium]|jgi:molybdate transport system permease protein